MGNTGKRQHTGQRRPTGLTGPTGLIGPTGPTGQERGRGADRAAPGAAVAFARFVLCGGGVGVASSFAVTAVAHHLPWALANALVTVVSTLLATELHARFTFGAGGRASWSQHAQSAGSAVGAYVVTCLAVAGLRYAVDAPGPALEQAVYLSASALTGVARFVVLRLVTFARRRAEVPVAACPLPAAAVGAAALVPAA
ncbi:GtrA family protein [Streptomyces sp. NPDC088785]|uniref:GtrA family protein n=1 Tax=Streptomyces sp. NPDC088785 TaxID=3365897 RepID=UPI0037F8102E